VCESRDAPPRLASSRSVLKTSRIQRPLRGSSLAGRSTRVWQLSAWAVSLYGLRLPAMLLCRFLSAPMPFVFFFSVFAFPERHGWSPHLDA
jgi:hypothetical protein